MDKLIVSLPGPPREVREMFSYIVIREVSDMIMVVPIENLQRGRLMCRSTCQPLAPSIRAASCTSGGIAIRSANTTSVPTTA